MISSGLQDLYVQMDALCSASHTAVVAVFETTVQQEAQPSSSRWWRSPD